MEAISLLALAAGAATTCDQWPGRARVRGVLVVARMLRSAPCGMAQTHSATRLQEEMRKEVQAIAAAQQTTQEKLDEKMTGMERMLAKLLEQQHQPSAKP